MPSRSASSRDGRSGCPAPASCSRNTGSSYSPTLMNWSLLPTGAERLRGFRELGQDLEDVTHDAVVGDLEDGRVGVLVDAHDHLGRRHPGQVLDGPADAAGHVERGRNRLARLADLVLVIDPAGVDDGPRRAD